MEGKVKCKICGKVGVANADKGLRRHLRLIHNISVSKDFCVGDYFEPTDPDAVIEIFSDPVKHTGRRKIKNGISGIEIIVKGRILLLGLYIHQWLMDEKTQRTPYVCINKKQQI